MEAIVQYQLLGYRRILAAAGCHQTLIRGISFQRTTRPSAIHDARQHTGAGMKQNKPSSVHATASVGLDH
jgi:hypothetical protein